MINNCLFVNVGQFSQQCFSSTDYIVNAYTICHLLSSEQLYKEFNEHKIPNHKFVKFFVARKHLQKNLIDKTNNLT